MDRYLIARFGGDKFYGDPMSGLNDVLTENVGLRYSNDPCKENDWNLNNGNFRQPSHILAETLKVSTLLYIIKPIKRICILSAYFYGPTGI